MRLFKLFDRKIIAVIALLVVILLSVKEPLPDLPTLIRRKLNLNKATNYLCIAEELPQEVKVNFFGNPFDPASDSNTIALYYRTQFFLAPRLLHLTSILDQQGEQDEIQWFIGANLDDEQVVQISEQYQLTLIKNCGVLYLFDKNTEPIPR